MPAASRDTPSLLRPTGRLLLALALPALLLLGGCLALRGVSAPSATPAASPVSFAPQAGTTMPTVTPTPAMPASALPLAAVFAPWYGYAVDGSCQGGMGSYH